MRAVVIGAGAIGGYLAATLAEAGHDVSLCVRTPFDELTIEEDGKTRKVPATIVAAPDDLPGGGGPADLVVVATKAQDTGSARPWLDAVVGPGTLVLMAQNGVEHEERVAAFQLFGTIVPSIVYIAAERVAAGQVVHHYSSRLILPDDAAGRQVAECFSGTKLSVETEKEFLTAAWRKLLSNVVANPITALTLRRMEVFQGEAIRQLGMDLLAEAIAVGRAAGAKFADDEHERVLNQYARANSNGGSSMLYDRLAGRPLEHEYLTGAVVRAGRRYGVATPLNAAILALLSAVDRAPIERP